MVETGDNAFRMIIDPKTDATGREYRPELRRLPRQPDGPH
jgi:hypothetical protein